MNWTRTKLKDNLVALYRMSTGHRRRRSVLIATTDPGEAFALAAEVASEHRAPIYLARPQGLWRFTDGHLAVVPPASPDIAGVLAHIEHSREEGAVYVLEDMIQSLRDHAGLRSRLAALIDPLPTARGLGLPQLLILVDAPSSGGVLPELFRSQIATLPHPLPRYDDLVDLVKSELPDLDQGLAAGTASALTGLTRTRAKDALWEALAAARADQSAILRHLRDIKEEVLRKELALTFLDGAEDETPAGLKEVWSYLARHRNRIGIPGHRRLKGLVFVGPPGTGKTLIAKSIGRSVGLPVVRFEIGRLISSYIGATENNILRATAVLDALAPLVVFIDEIEKALAGAQSSHQTDGGTMARSYGTFLSWLNDTEAPLLIIGTANHLDRLGDFGDTLTRRGRFDQVFFVDLPGEQTRCEIIKRSLAKEGINNFSSIEEVGLATKGLSGADLVGLVTEAASRAQFEGRALDVRHIELELDLLRPGAQARLEAFAGLRRWALSRYRPASVEPPDAACQPDSTHHEEEHNVY